MRSKRNQPRRDPRRSERPKISFSTFTDRRERSRGDGLPFNMGGLLNGEQDVGDVACLQQVEPRHDRILTWQRPAIKLSIGRDCSSKIGSHHSDPARMPPHCSRLGLHVLNSLDGCSQELSRRHTRACGMFSLLFRIFAPKASCVNVIETLGEKQASEGKDRPDRLHPTRKTRMGVCISHHARQREAPHCEHEDTRPYNSACDTRHDLHGSKAATRGGC